jgi:hypothetical protein
VELWKNRGTPPPGQVAMFPKAFQSSLAFHQGPAGHHSGNWAVRLVQVGPTKETDVSIDMV